MRDMDELDKENGLRVNERAQPDWGQTALDALDHKEVGGRYRLVLRDGRFLTITGQPDPQPEWLLIRSDDGRVRSVIPWPLVYAFYPLSKGEDGLPEEGQFWPHQLASFPSKVEFEGQTPEKKSILSKR